MPRPESDPEHRRGPARWTWRDHARGQPAEPVAWQWLAPRIGAGADGPPLSRNPHGRPLLATPDGRHDASWSHSAGLLLIALGEEVDIGVDIELVRQRPRALEVSRRYFAPAETAWLAATPEALRDTAFTRLWCAKEAVLKAHGRGLAFGLHRLAFAEHGGALALVTTAAELGPAAAWTLHEFSPVPGYRAALAWRERGGTS